MYLLLTNVYDYPRPLNYKIKQSESDKSLCWFDFSIHPQMDYEGFIDNAMVELEKLAATLTIPSYAIDDQAAIKITDGNIEMVSEGNWELFVPDDI